MKYIIDCNTGEETTREMTKAEETAEAKSAQEYAKSMAKAEAELAAREAKKLEVLAKLGLTQDEVTALLA